MKSYPHLIKRIYYEPVAITMAKFMAIHSVMESRLIGGAQTQAGDASDGDSLNISRDGSTAIIPVTGIIGKHLAPVDTMSSGPITDLDDLNTMIDVAEQDPSIKEVLFFFNTPGGSATGVLESGRKIYGMTKPTIAFTDMECCSAGIWLASQARRFYSTESANLGSIGVWSAYIDLTKQMEIDGEKMNSISAGKYKLMGAWWKPMSDEERQLLQAGIDKIHAQFKEAVNSRRQIDPQFMEGQTFDGEQAAQIGMTDGTVEDISELLE